LTTRGNDNEEYDISNSLVMKFVLIPHGTFTMGHPPEPYHTNDNPLHQVTITQDYYMQTKEVTQGQWKAVMGNNPSKFSSCGDDCPVEKVSWDDAQDFIKAINTLGEGIYTLPTEAQWEYAARAGTTTRYNTGDCISDGQANYRWDFPYEGCPDLNSKPQKKTVKVASYPPNAWGLYDMHGNIWELCQDWYKIHTADSVIDPIQQKVNNPSDEYPTIVVRGGSWTDHGREYTSGFREKTLPDNDRESVLGFRLVRLVENN